MLKLHCTWIFTVTSHWKYTYTLLQWMKQSKKSFKILAQSSSKLCSQIGTCGTIYLKLFSFRSHHLLLFPLEMVILFAFQDVLRWCSDFCFSQVCGGLVQLLRDDTFHWITAVLCVSSFINVAATCRSSHDNCSLLVKSKLVVGTACRFYFCLASV